MRAFVTAFVAGGLLLTAGCPGSRLAPAEVIWQAVDDGLAIEAEIPSRYYVRGRSIPMNVVVRNTSGDETVIRAGSSALVHVKIWRKTTIGWERVKRYPIAAVMLVSPWRLPAGATREFTLNLPVEPDWPTGEPLRVTAELNGRPGLVAGGLIRVFATQADYDTAVGAEQSK